MLIDKSINLIGLGWQAIRTVQLINQHAHGIRIVELLLSFPEQLPQQRATLSQPSHSVGYELCRLFFLPN